MLVLQKMMTGFEVLSPEDACLFLQEEIPTLSSDILQKIVDHKMDGEVFLSLNDEYLREIAPLLGDWLKIRRMLVKVSTSHMADVRIRRFIENSEVFT